MKHTRKIGNLTIVIISIFSGLYLFNEVALYRQYDLAKFLASMAATIFAILGVWIAVLDPKGLLGAKDSDQSSIVQDLTLKLLHPWLYAIGVFATTLVITFTLGIFADDLACKQASQSIFGVLLTLCFIMLLDSILSTLIPVVTIRKEYKENRLRNSYE